MCSIEQHQILKARIPILLTPITINRASAFRIVRSRYVIGGETAIAAAYLKCNISDLLDGRRQVLAKLDYNKSHKS